MKANEITMELMNEMIDPKLATGLRSMKQVRAYIAACATHAKNNRTDKFYKSYVKDVKCIKLEIGLDGTCCYSYIFKYKQEKYMLQEKAIGSYSLRHDFFLLEV